MPTVSPSFCALCATLSAFDLVVADSMMIVQPSPPVQPGKLLLAPGDGVVVGIAVVLGAAVSVGLAVANGVVVGVTVGVTPGGWLATADGVGVGVALVSF